MLFMRVLTNQLDWQYLSILMRLYIDRIAHWAKNQHVFPLLKAIMNS
jgi:hypothetical protein